jgi:hypothetical protein
VKKRQGEGEKGGRGEGEKGRQGGYIYNFTFVILHLSLKKISNVKL